jgi:hypothetical protein
LSAQSAQKVHSNVQIRAAALSGGKSQSQHSQLGFNFNMMNSNVKSVSRRDSPALKPGLSAAEKGRDPFLVIVSHAGQRELIDIHMTGEIVERVGQPIDGQFRHCDRDRRLPGNLLRERHGVSEGSSRFRELLDQSPLKRFLGADALISEDHRLLGPRRPYQVQHSRHALPTHIHPEPDLRNSHMSIVRHHTKIQRYS